jgi:hypothetical protein
MDSKSWFRFSWVLDHDTAAHDMQMHHKDVVVDDDSDERRVAVDVVLCLEQNKAVAVCTMVGPRLCLRVMY